MMYWDLWQFFSAIDLYNVSIQYLQGLITGLQKIHQHTYSLSCDSDQSRAWQAVQCGAGYAVPYYTEQPAGRNHMPKNSSGKTHPDETDRAEHWLTILSICSHVPPYHPSSLFFSTSLQNLRVWRLGFKCPLKYSYDDSCVI